MAVGDAKRAEIRLAVFSLPKVMPGMGKVVMIWMPRKRELAEE
jgi:hypothetical protein